MQQIIFRSRFGIVLTIATWAISLSGIVSSILSGAGLTPVVLLLALGWFVWLAFWRPSVVCRADDVELRNLLRDVTIPYDSIEDVDTRFSLKVLTRDGKGFSAWAAPAPGGASSLRTRREHDRARDVPADLRTSGAMRPGDLTSSVSGAPATVIRRELEARAGRQKSDAAVTVRWQPLLVTVSAALAVGSVVAMVAG